MLTAIDPKMILRDETDIVPAGLYSGMCDGNVEFRQSAMTTDSLDQPFESIDVNVDLWLKPDVDFEVTVVLWRVHWTCL